MATTLATAIDQYATMTTAAHAVGDTTLAVASVAGLGSPTPAKPIRISLYAAGGTPFVNFFVTGVSGNTLTIAPHDGTTDVAMPSGSGVGCFQSAAAINDLNGLVGPLGSAIATDGSNITIGSSTVNTAGKVSTTVSYGQTGHVINQTITDAMVTATGANIAESSGLTLSTTYLANSTLASAPNGPYTLVPTGINSRQTYGSYTAKASGTIQAFTGVIDIQGCSNPESESAPYMGINRSYSDPCRQWFTDFSLHGPIGPQTHLLNGITMCVNKYGPGVPTGGPSGGVWAITAPGQGGGREDGHANASTYPNEVGVGVVGFSSAGLGWTVGVGVGGYGSGWMASGTRSQIGTGVDIQDTQTAAIGIHGCYSDSATQINWGGVANLHQKTNTSSTGGPSLANSLSDIEVDAAGKGFVLTDTQTNVRNRLTLTNGALVFTPLSSTTTPTPTPTPTTTPTATTAWSDTFTRSNGSLGNLETPSGLAWIQSGGSYTIVSNAATTSTAGAIAAVDTGALGHTVQADLTPSTTGSLPGLIFRRDSSGNMIYARFENQNIVCRYVINGNESSPHAATYAFTAGTAYTFKAVVAGNNVNIYLGPVGGTLSSEISFSDAAIPTGTIVGVDNFGSDMITVDNFKASTP